MTPCHMADDIVQRNRFGDKLAKVLGPFSELLLNLVYDLPRMFFVP